jgi:alpha-tubulin suppressor-like RCC1 family protein
MPWASRYGTTTERLTPTAVAMPAGVTFTSVSAGNAHTCGLTPAGAAYCWGANASGQLGDDTTTDRLTPVKAVP